MLLFKERINLLKKAIAKMAYLDETVNDMVRYQIVKHNLTASAFSSKEPGVSANRYMDTDIVVSLTTHGDRIHTVFQTIESIFAQSCKPNKVVLYLGRDEFSENNLPVSLCKQRERGLEIKFVKDIRSYTKLLPALNAFPEASVITVDDDYMYPFDLVERLIRAHNTSPEAVCCFQSRIIKLKNDRALAPYNSFEMCFPSKDFISDTLLGEGFGGILYPPRSLDQEVFNEAAFLKLAPYADDLWFKAMALLKGTPVLQLARNHSWFASITSEKSVQDIGLIRHNVKKGGNDAQLKALFDHYDLYGKIRNREIKS